MVTFDYIWNCWKSGEYPEDFDESLDEYLNIKYQIFSNVRIDDITGWVKRILVALEIGLERDRERFGEHRERWRTILGKNWLVSVEDQWVSWV